MFDLKIYISELNNNVLVSVAKTLIELVVAIVGESPNLTT